MENKSSKQDENKVDVLSKIQIDTYTAPDNSWSLNVEHTGEITDFEWVENERDEEELTSDDNFYGEYNRPYNG